MSDHEREIQDLDQRRHRLEEQLEDTRQENRLLNQETKDLQDATMRMRDQKEKILERQPEASDDAGKLSGDSVK